MDMILVGTCFYDSVSFIWNRKKPILNVGDVTSFQWKDAFGCWSEVLENHWLFVHYGLYRLRFLSSFLWCVWLC